MQGRIDLNVIDILYGTPGTLELSLSIDMDDRNLTALIQTVVDLHYDICILTGDYHARTFGAIEGAVAGMQRLITMSKQRVYGILENHDSILMLPELESMGVIMRMNEVVVLEKTMRGFCRRVWMKRTIFAGIILRRRLGIFQPMPCLLLSHTPEIYRQAAHADFDVRFCGRPHGGQICLSGGIPLTLDSKCACYMSAGKWQYQQMQGYTSVGASTLILNARFNCPPEVIIHRLQQAVRI